MPSPQHYLISLERCSQPNGSEVVKGRENCYCSSVVDGDEVPE
jgi:hypothetical protein